MFQLWQVFISTPRLACGMCVEYGSLQPSPLTSNHRIDVHTNHTLLHNERLIILAPSAYCRSSPRCSVLWFLTFLVLSFTSISHCINLGIVRAPLWCTTRHRKRSALMVLNSYYIRATVSSQFHPCHASPLQWSIRYLWLDRSLLITVGCWTLSLALMNLYLMKCHTVFSTRDTTLWRQMSRSTNLSPISLGS